MTNFNGSVSPLGYQGIDIEQQPIFVGNQVRAPNGGDIYPPGTVWDYVSGSLHVFYISSGGAQVAGVTTGVWSEFVTSAGSDVISVTGTANQVLATPTTGSVVVSLIGPYTPATYTAHGVLIGEGTSSIASTTAGTAGQVLTSGGASADPTWTTATFPTTAGATGTILRSNGTNWVASTDTYPDTVVAGDIVIATATNVVGSLADVATGQVLMSGGVGVAPAYSGSPSVSGSVTAGTTLTATLGNITATNGNLNLNSAGNKLNIHASTAASDSVGTSAALDGASPSQLVVSTTAVTAASKIFLTYNTAGGTLGSLSIGTIVPNVSFQIISSANGDTSTVNYLIIN